MELPEISASFPLFRPLCINAHYTGSRRGLAADTLAAYLLEGRPTTVCTSLISASRGKVSDVIEVPADSVSAQLEHVERYERVDCIRAGILGAGAAAGYVLDYLKRSSGVPSLLDLTLTGPSGEDIAEARVLSTVRDRLGEADVVTLRRIDAELVASMEITSLDDAQVAAQRVARLGARAVVLKCGSIKARDHDEEAEATAVDLLYDGSDFALFEAPLLNVDATGASSLFSLALLRSLVGEASLEEAVQTAKGMVTEGLRRNVLAIPFSLPYFQNSGVPTP